MRGDKTSCQRFEANHRLKMGSRQTPVSARNEPKLCNRSHADYDALPASKIPVLLADGTNDVVHLPKNYPIIRHE